MSTRRTTSRQVRQDAGEIAFLRQHDAPTCNGLESELRSAGGLTYAANYSKGLPHDAQGHVDPAAYRTFLRALTSGNHSDLEHVPLGTAGPNARKLTNPQAGLAFDLQGPDAQALTMPPPPRIDGPEHSAEMAELYWMALLRDVNFTDYGTGAGTDVGPNTSTDAANSLTNDFTAFTGPRDAAGAVTPATLFRGFTRGDLVGPYVSQFLLKPVVFGTLRFNQRQRTAKTDLDFMMAFAEWLSIQNGAQPAVAPGHPSNFDTFRRYIRNARDLATYVHFDALYEAYLNACLILLEMGAPFDPGNPYQDSTTQAGFGTFGGPHILSLVTEVATRALKAVWYQKWFVHRRLRPEAFGGLIHNQVNGIAAYPIDGEILDTSGGSVLDRVHQFNLGKGHDTFLLPMAFPEGSPTHPAYGAGHATVAGACVTILKAWFDESFIIPNPVVSNAMGNALDPYMGPGAGNLTVGGELNKVAANVGIGRNMAGVHWRTDYTASMNLGEEIAIGILEEQKLCYNERHSLTLTRFDGTTTVI
jgi:hypothetical protein